MDEIRANGIGGAIPSPVSQTGSAEAASTAGQPSFASEMGDALSKLSDLDNNGKLREDAILNAKAIIKNWTPPSDSQITTILENMRGQLLA